jgi:hypothetical protein
MQLANGSLSQMLLRRRNVVTGRQVCHGLFSYPATVQNSCLGVGEAPLEVGDCPIVGTLRPEAVRVLEVELFVGSTFIWCKPYRLRRQTSMLEQHSYPGWALLSRLC